MMEAPRRSAGAPEGLNLKADTTEIKPRTSQKQALAIVEHGLVLTICADGLAAARALLRESVR